MARKENPEPAGLSEVQEGREASGGDVAPAYASLAT
jgi:hypothetical protein